MKLVNLKSRNQCYNNFCSQEREWRSSPTLKSCEFRSERKNKRSKSGKPNWDSRTSTELCSMMKTLVSTRHSWYHLSMKIRSLLSYCDSYTLPTKMKGRALIIICRLEMYRQQFTLSNVKIFQIELETMQFLFNIPNKEINHSFIENAIAILLCYQCSSVKIQKCVDKNYHMMRTFNNCKQNRHLETKWLRPLRKIISMMR